MSKFLLAMGGVVLSSLIIFISLSLYNKFLLKKPSVKNLEHQSNSLSTPKNLKEAISSFLEKTR